MSSGVLRVSERLRQFVEEAPYHRRTISESVRNAARGLPTRATVADIGVGDSPDRELFDHRKPLALDWSQSIRRGAFGADAASSAHDNALPNERVGASLPTQVQQHVPNPASIAPRRSPHAGYARRVLPQTAGRIT